MHVAFWKVAGVVAIAAAWAVGASVSEGQQVRLPVRPAPRPQARPQYRPQPRPVYRQPPARPIANNNNNQRPRDVTATNDYVLTFADKGKVRMMEEPLEFDEKGQRKKFTAEELKNLKGETPAEQKLVGYKADFSDLRVGDNVKVYLGTFKPNPKKKDTEKKTARKAEGDEKSDDAKGEKKDADEEAEDGRWVAAGVLEGTVTRLDKPTGSLRFTVRVTTRRMETPQRANTPRPAARPAGKQAAQEINPDEKQATMIVVAKRPEGGTTEAAKKK